jgi:sulfate/thiosulfate transport system substrate-binding protein
MPRFTRPLTLLAAALLIAIPTIAASAASKGAHLTLVAYSIPQPAYNQLIPAYKASPAGSGSSFTTSYGASGSQAKAIIAGLKADVVNLALKPDMDLLVNAGIVNSNWKQGGYGGIVTNSLVVFAVRPGNPKHLRRWNDLLKPGVEVITPNPFTSGGARWNILAAYGAWRRGGLNNNQAINKLLRLFQNVSVQDTSARNALQTFLSGKGDVLLAYEADVSAAVASGAAIREVIPRRTILIQMPAAVTSTSSHPTEAASFLNYLWSPQAQTIFAQNGFRPVLKSVAKKFAKNYPSKGLDIFKVTDHSIGGWDVAQPRFFDPQNGIMARIEARVGGVTG